VEKERRHRGRPAEDVADTLPDNFDPEHEERLLHMEQALSELPEQDQMLIRLHYYEQRKTADIAQLTGLTQQNVLVRLHRIREKLKEKMNRESNK